ncbi:hypothetical protein [Caloranaerobacter ferrireducens]|uniref:hypothetical protein n=1 Tax=Caloranaerobacter ferrireducens TaxID=1323370 RepID=UPI00084D8690|nr:hypothetical protein [Caloranaerobacter ferrireducens]
MKKLKLSMKDLSSLPLLYKEKKYLIRISQLRQLFCYDKRINILVFDSLYQLANYVGSELPKWVIGTNFKNNVLILDYNIWKNRHTESFSQIVIHEMVHIIINEITRYRCPLWLNEGLAMFFANQINNESIIQKKNLASISLLDLSYNDPNFYQISAYIVLLLIKRHGLEKIISKINYKTNFLQDEIIGVDCVKQIAK